MSLYYKNMKKILIFGIITLIIIIAIVSSDDKKNTELSPSQNIVQPSEEQEELEELQAEYFIDFDISLEGRNIALIGNTNLPNKAILSLGIYRYAEYFDETINEPLPGKRVVDLVNTKLTVQDGNFNYSSYLTDKEWYKKDLSENEIMGLRLTKIYDDCYASIAFTPARNSQPSRVYKILGNKFEKMEGEQVEDAGSVGRVISLNKNFILPVEEGVIAK